MNIALRNIKLVFFKATAICSKTFLIFYIAAIFDSERVGEYGIITATIIYFVYLAGLELYTVSNRAIMLGDKDQEKIISNSMALYILLYILTFPVFILFFTPELSGSITTSVLFFFVCVLEHLNQEFYRLLIAKSRADRAIRYHFYRNLIWPILCILDWQFFGNQKNFYNLFIYWFSVNFIVLTIAIKVEMVFEVRAIIKKEIDPRWILFTLKKVVPFILAVLSIRAISTLDKYYLKFEDKTDLLATYIIFFMVFQTAISLIEAGVYSLEVPKIVTLTKGGDFNSLEKLLSKTNNLAILIYLLIFSVAIAALSVDIFFLGSIFSRGFHFTFFSLAGYALFYIASLKYHYSLYARQSDRQIAIAHSLTLVVFLLSLMNIPLDSELTLNISMISSSIFLFLIKYLFATYCR